MSFFQILTLSNPQKDIQRIFSLQVGLQSGLIREAIQKKCPPPFLLFFMFLKFHLKSMDLSLFLEGGWVSRKDHLVTLLRCHYWLGWVGVQGKSDNVTLYPVLFLTSSLSNSKYGDLGRVTKKKRDIE